MSLEKQITYGSAVLDPETELEKIEDNSRVKLKALDNLIYLCHFDEPVGVWSNWYEISEEIEGLKIVRNDALFYPDFPKFGPNCLLNILTENRSGAIAEVSPELVGIQEGTIDFWF